MIRQAVSGLVDWTYGSAWWLRAFFRRESPQAFVEPGPDEGCHTPLVLLPGIWEPWQYLVPLARALNAEGHPTWLVPALGSNGAPIEAAARIVAGFLVTNELTGVILVAHSKGGLVGKAVMLDPAVADRVRGMVALSTPFGGSSLSWPIFRHSPLGIFAPTGPTIVDLAAQRDVNARIVSLQPTHDQVIPEGSSLAGARNVTLEMSGHFRPLRDARVHRIIHEQVHELE